MDEYLKPENEELKVDFGNRLPAVASQQIDACRRGHQAGRANNVFGLSSSPRSGGSELPPCAVGLPGCYARRRCLLCSPLVSFPSLSLHLWILPCFANPVRTCGFGAGGRGMLRRRRRAHGRPPGEHTLSPIAGPEYTAHITILPSNYSFRK